MIGKQDRWHNSLPRPVVTQNSQERTMVLNQIVDKVAFISALDRNPVFGREHQAGFIDNWSPAGRYIERGGQDAMPDPRPTRFEEIQFLPEQPQQPVMELLIHEKSHGRDVGDYSDWILTIGLNLFQVSN